MGLRLSQPSLAGDWLAGLGKMAKVGTKFIFLKLSEFLADVRLVQASKIGAVI